MAKSLQQELDEYGRLLSIFRKLYAEDGTITPDEQSHLDVLEGKIKQILPAADSPVARNGNGQPLTAIASSPKAEGTDITDIIGGGVDVPKDNKLPPTPAVTKDEKAGQDSDLKKAAAKKDYEIKLARLKPDLDKVANSKPTDQATVELRTKILATRQQMELYANTIRDYVAAQEEINKLPPLLTRYKEAASQPVVKEPDAKTRYESLLASIKPSMDSALDKKKWTDEVMKTEQAKVAEKKKELDDVVAKKDYAQAITKLTALKQQLEHFRSVAQSQSTAKTQFETKWSANKEDTLKLINFKPADHPAIKDSRAYVARRYDEMKAMLLRGDYIMAQNLLDMIIAFLPQFRRDSPKIQKEIAVERHGQDQASAKVIFEGNVSGIKEEILSILRTEPTDAKLKAIRKQIAEHYKQMEALVSLGDYVKANEQLDELAMFVFQYQSADKSAQKEADKKRYEEQRKRIQPSLDRALGKPWKSPEMNQLQAGIKTKKDEMESAASKQLYDSALKKLAELQKLVDNVLLMQANKERFEAEWPNISDYVTDILGFSWDADELKKLQADVKAKKDAMEAAAAKEKFKEALGHLETLARLVESFRKESRKTAKGCQWVRDTAGALGAMIEIKYSSAAAKLNAAALAYKTALQLHKDALESKKHDFARDFLVSLFFIGLGGATGGAVGVMAQNFFKRITEVGRGAVVDATKDIVKFVTRSLQEAGKTELKDPLAGRNPLSGDALDLALGMGAELLIQKALLQEIVKGLYLLVRDNPKCIKNEDVIRFDVDPIKTLDKDPFLGILDKVVADVKTYSRLVWLHWADDIKFDGTIARHADAIRDQVGTVESLEKRIQAHEKREIERQSRRTPGSV